MRVGQRQTVFSILFAGKTRRTLSVRNCEDAWIQRREHYFEGRIQGAGPRHKYFSIPPHTKNKGSQDLLSRFLC